MSEMKTHDKPLAVVTGGAGFVGSHLCERLVKENYHVISLDNYFTGSVDNHVAGVEYREGHTKNIATLVPENPDLLFHLGEYSRIAPSLEEPALVFDLNIIGTLAVLEFWRAKKFKLIYAGSSTKFAGLSQNDPTACHKNGESDAFVTDNRVNEVPGRDRAPYNFSKAVNSELVHNYGRWYNLNYSIAYFYNVYGPRERAGQFEGRYGTVVETFRQCALKQEPCVINGTGDQTRAFTHVLDTVEALWLISQKGEKDEYSISASETYSLNQLADLFGITEKIYAPATRSSRSTGGDDTSKLQALGWKQSHTLENYCKTNLSKV
jgi:UDP-glucose 4-epimerase